MIRRAVYADVPALRMAFARLLAETDATGPGYPVHDVRALDTFTLLCAHRLEHDPALLAYVSVDDATGALEGFLGGEVAERLIGAPTRFGAAHWLYVEPAARGRGIARALVRAAIPDLLAAGVTAVELASRAGDDQWQRRGWYPFLVHHVLPLEAVAAAAAERVPAAAPPPPAPAETMAPVGETNGAGAEPPAPVAATNGAAPETPRPRRRHRRRAPRPPEAACS